MPGPQKCPVSVKSCPKGQKRVLKYVGDPVFGFKPSKTRIEVCKTLCRDVRMEATECHNAVILFKKFS